MTETPDLSAWLVERESWKEKVWGLFEEPLTASDVPCLPIPCPSIPCPDFETVAVECTGPLCWTCRALLDAEGRCVWHG